MHVIFISLGGFSFGGAVASAAPVQPINTRDDSNKPSIVSLGSIGFRVPVTSTTPVQPIYTGDDSNKPKQIISSTQFLGKLLNPKKFVKKQQYHSVQTLDISLKLINS